MSPFLRKVKTASGATAVQIVEKKHGVRTILEHLGSAHDEAELAALMRVGHDKLHANQPALELPGERGVRPGVAVIEGKRSQLLVDVVRDSWGRLGFDAIEDEAFFQLVLARLVEPTSKLDSLRVIAELGLVPVHLSTVKRCLKRCADKGYRDKIAQACFQHVWSEQGGDVSLLLYDVTTLYFETDTEDDLRKVGFSKERRVDPQIVVGLLVDRTGHPLEIACFEGNKAETHTIIPVIKAFQQRHGVADMVVVADAGMLSAANLKAIDEAGLRFIVGSRVVKAPHDLAKHFRWHGTAFTDGQVIDTITMRSTAPDPNRVKTRAEPVWDPAVHPTAWRAVWQYSAKRAARAPGRSRSQRWIATSIWDSSHSGFSRASRARIICSPTSNNSKAVRRRLAALPMRGTLVRHPSAPVWLAGKRFVQVPLQSGNAFGCERTRLPQGFAQLSRMDDVNVLHRKGAAQEGPVGVQEAQHPADLDVWVWCQCVADQLACLWTPSTSGDRLRPPTRRSSRRGLKRPPSTRNVGRWLRYRFASMTNTPNRLMAMWSMLARLLGIRRSLRTRTSSPAT